MTSLSPSSQRRRAKRPRGAFLALALPPSAGPALSPPPCAPASHSSLPALPTSGPNRSNRGAALPLKINGGLTLLSSRTSPKPEAEEAKPKLLTPKKQKKLEKMERKRQKKVEKSVRCRLNSPLLAALLLHDVTSPLGQPLAFFLIFPC